MLNVAKNTSLIQLKKQYVAVGGGSRLPQEYQEVAYIESTGTQYIVTDINGAPNYITEVKFKPMSGTSTTWYQVLGHRPDYSWVTPSSTRFQIAFNQSENRIAIDLGTGNIGEEAYINTNEPTTVTVNGNDVTINNVKYTGSGDFGGQSDYPLYIFSENDHGTPEAPFKGYIYYVKIMDKQHNLLYYFIPCYRKSDNKPGMYDLANNQFYTNSGTDEFVKGNEVPQLIELKRLFVAKKKSRLPDDYQEVEYIESTGTQYINTGIQVQAGVKSELGIDVYVTKLPTSNSHLMGADMGRYLALLQSGYIALNNNDYIAYNVLNKWVKATHIRDVAQYTRTLIVEGQSKTIIYTQDNVKPICIFYLEGYDNRCWSCRLREFYYKVNDEYITYCIPCYRKSDNVVGMYDLVNNRFYTNDGIGAFIKGQNVPSVKLIEI